MPDSNDISIRLQAAIEAGKRMTDRLNTVLAEKQAQTQVIATLEEQLEEYRLLVEELEDDIVKMRKSRVLNARNSDRSAGLR